MYKAKAYSAASAMSPMASTSIARRDPTDNDVQIEILYCGICHSDLHTVRNEWKEFMPWSTLDAGFSFQRVLEEARHQMARQYLNNSALELNEAAYLLGYEDSNSFVRAFRTWEGVPPAHWREEQRARAAS